MCRGGKAIARDVEGRGKALVGLIPNADVAIVLRGLAQERKALEVALGDVTRDGSGQAHASVGATEDDARGFDALVDCGKGTAVLL